MDWTLSLHYDPTTSPFGYAVTGDSWSQFLAGATIAKLSNEEKETARRKFADEIWGLAGPYGYERREVDQWLRDTLQQRESLPIKELKLKDRGSVYYRDLSSIPFPRLHPFKMLLRAIRETDAKTWLWVILFTGLPTLLIIFLFISLGWTIGSSQVPIMAKITVASLIATFAFGVWVLNNVHRKRVMGPSFSVFSLPEYGYVSAEGQWRGVNQKIGFPDNASKIICEKGKDSCREIQAYLVNGSALAVDETSWPIVKWDDQEIVVQMDSECSTTKMMINFKDQAVTQIRVGRNPMPADCMIGEEKFISEMVSGIDLALGRLRGK